MRYEDASQTGSGQVDARNDADHLAARDYGPATGNVISGAGTITGSAGLDVTGAGLGRITAIDGAGGSDTSFSGGKLSVQGQYGTLSIDATGNYSYERDPGTPAGVSDLFHYTLATSAGATDTAQLIINIGDLPKLATDATRVVPGTDGVVILPAGVELSDIRVVGRDLVVTLPDGSTMIIVDGAIFVPQLVLGGVEVPASNLAALLIGSEPRPAAGDLAGNPQSSGGNFEVPVAPLDPGVPLGDLLPPTELFYTPPEFEEIAELVEENDPPLVGVSAVNVSEEGVASVRAPNPDSSGSPDTTNSATNGGVLPVSDPDGDPLTVILGTPNVSLTSAGVAITWSVSLDGHTLTGSAGANSVITITINDAGSYTVNLLRPIDHPTGGGEQGTSFVVPVSVSDGEDVTGGGAITVTIEDDSPTLSGLIGEPNLVVDDTTLGINDTESFSGAFTVSFGADGPAASNSVTYVLGVTAGPSGIVDVATGEQVNLVMNGAVVEGRTAVTNQLVFTVAVDSSGNVTLDQVRAVQHNDPADPVETGASAATLTSDSLVTLSIVATDRDGDTASISVNIGQNLRFEDDGPSIGLADVGQPNLTVDETVLTTNASASFAGLFTGVYGADGAGTTTYALSVTAGPSGLVDVASGEAVILSLTAGGVVEGRTATGGALVFTVSIDAAGVVTLDQLRAIQHSPDSGPDQPATLSADSLVRVVATITDRDGDAASASVNIGTNLVFEDDAPSIGVNGSIAEANLTVDETVLTTNASASFAGLFTGVYGADGAGTTTYALSVTAGPSGLVDVASGEAVILSLTAGGVVEGRTATGGALVFTVSIDAAGVVTLDQLRAIQHSPDSGPDQPATLSADSLVRVVATITDRDGDAASASVNIGTNLVFEDDAPSIGVNGSIAEANLTVDETVLTTNASASFAGLFTGVYGADGAGTTTYALSVTAGPSGLVDVASGEAVILSLTAGGVVEGRTATGGALVFTVSIDAAGVVTLDQLRAIQHSPDSGPDQPATLSADSLVRVVATITDRDGDAASASVNIGTNLVFEDDAPSIGVNGSIAEANLTVDETVLTTNASASFAGLFTGVYGADGAGTTTYALSVTAGPSGLVDVASGEAVILSLTAGGVVEGRTATGGALVFTVSIDAAGVVTLDQLRAIQHSPDSGPDQPATLSADSLVRVVATITDRDGDAASASVNIGTNLVFEDDAPSIGVNGSIAEANLTVDETVLTTNASASFAGLFTGVYGADGAGTTTYALSVTAGPSGLVDVASGEAVILSLTAGGVVEGRTATGGALVFTVSIDAAGVVTLDQLRAIQHSPDSGPDQPATLSADSLVRVVATITDRDGDAASASVNIGTNLVFEDDAPSIGVNGSIAEANLTVDETVLTTNASASFAGLFTGVYGADGAGTTTYALSVTAGPSGLVDVASGEAVILSLTAGGVVEGRTATGGALVFTVSIDAAGVVTLDQLRAIQHSPDSGPDQPATLSADSLVRVVATITDRDGDAASASVNIGTNLVFEDDAPSIGVNGSIAEANLTVDETVLTTNASASFAGLFTGVYGADGAGTTTYALSVTAGPSGLVDVASGEAVILSLTAGGVVEGRTATGGALVFTVSIDAAGVVTLDQLRAIQHSPDSGPDQPATLSADSLVRVVATITDRDGDAASASVNIGTNLVFEDDAPSIGVNGSIAEANLTVDETVLTTNASASFAGLFTGVYGADGAGTTTYALSVTAGPSGLVDVASGEAVILSLTAGGVVEGRTATGGALVFTVSIDAAGVVTLDQLRAIQHSPDSGPDQPATLSADSLVRVVATITDRDGDAASASVNIGTNLVFEDDAPSIGVNGSIAEANLTVDETVLTTNASASFAGLFTGVYGADGAGTTTYALSVTAGPSGLVDVASGEAVILSLTAGGVVEGRTATGGALVFTVSIDAAGVVTLDQLRAIQHSPDSGPDQPATLSADSLVRVVATITDRDGDAASASVNIGTNLVFEDDAPSIGVNGSIAEANLTVDETVLTTNASASFAGLFTGVYGADGAGTTTYALSVTAGPSGLVDVASGEAVILSLTAGGVVEGRTATGGALVFTVSIDAAGVVTLDQLRAIQHSPDSGPDQPATLSADSLVRVVATITDRDGDAASASVNIGTNLVFEDDAPSAVAAVSISLDNSAGSDSAFLDAGNDVDNNYGADGAGKVIFTAATITSLQAQALTSGLATLNYSISPDGTVLTATKSTDASVVFTITLQPAGFADQYVVNIVQPLDSLADIDFNGGGYQFVGGNEAWAGFLIAGDNQSQDLLLTPQINGADDGTINTSDISGGVGSGNSVGATETFRVDFVVDLSGNSAGPGGYGVAGNRDHVFDSHYNTNGASALFTATTGSTIKITAFQDPDGNNIVGDGTIDGITQIVISYGTQSSGLITVTSTPTAYTVNGNVYTVTLNADGSVDVGGVVGTSGAGAIGTQIAVFTDTVGTIDANPGYNSLEFTYVSGDTFKIGDFAAAVISAEPVNFTVPISIQDKDGDTVSSGNLDITLTPPIVLDLDGDGVEFLDRSAGVAYDYDGDGVAEATAWAGADDGILVRDANGNGAVDGSSEFVFGGNGVTDMEALRAQYGDTLDANDADFASFKVWQDANSNGAVDDGELVSLTDAGITSISLVSNGQAYTAANGDVVVAGTSSFTRTDGSTGDAADAAFVTGAKSTMETERIAANSNNVVLAGVIAAAGLAVSAPAAAAVDDGDIAAGRISNAVVSVEAFDLSILSLSTDTAMPALMGDMRATLGTVEMPFQSAMSMDFANGSIGELMSGFGESTASTALLQGSDMIAGQMAMPMLASNVAMPSADALAAMAGLGNAQSTVTVEQIVADSLQGGGGPDINALLDSLPTQGLAENAGIDSMASISAGFVPTWDTGHGAGFTFAGTNVMSSEALVLHHDAIQPVANG